MDVQAVHDQMPFGGIRRHRQGVLDVGKIVGFGAPVSHSGSNNLPTSNIETSNQGLRAMPNLLKLPTFGFTRSHRQVFGFAFQCLNTCHLVQADGEFSIRCPFSRAQVGVADIFDFVLEGRVGGGFSQ